MSGNLSHGWAAAILPRPCVHPWKMNLGRKNSAWGKLKCLRFQSKTYWKSSKLVMSGNRFQVMLRFIGKRILCQEIGSQGKFGLNEFGLKETAPNSLGLRV